MFPKDAEKNFFMYFNTYKGKDREVDIFCSAFSSSSILSSCSAHKAFYLS